MKAFHLFLVLMYLATTASASWYGIAVVGQHGNDGQVYTPHVSVNAKSNNFGYNKQYDVPASTANKCKLYTSGGYNSGSFVDTLIEVDPRTDQTRVVTKLFIPRSHHTITATDPDSLMSCGGQSVNGHIDACEVCHIASPVCFPIYPVMPCTVLDHAAVFFKDHLYLIGGYVNNSASNQMLDFLTVGQWGWTERPTMNAKRGFQPGAVMLNNGHILVCGGDIGLKSCESYDPDSHNWTPRASMNRARVYFSLVRSEGVVYAIGGRNEPTVETYDERNDKWTMGGHMLGNYRYNAAAAIDHACVA